MIGDSITDCGRARPVGQGLTETSMGNGYVSLVAAFFAAVSPAHGVRVINMGISGNTVRDLKARWQTDVEALHPDWLSILIGINDVWRQFDSPNEPARHVQPEEFERTLEDLVRTTAPSVRGLVLMTPYMIEPDRNDPMRTMMDSYGKIVRRIALDHGALLVDIQAEFDKAMAFIKPDQLSSDRIHPNLSGHMIIAHAFLTAVGALPDVSG